MKKQYVNLEKDNSDESFGNTKTIKVCLEKKACSPVFLFLDPDKGNKAPKELILSSRAGVDAVGSIKTTKMSGADGVLEFDLILSNYGGDKFSVKASMDSSGSKEVKVLGETFEVWKRLYYQLSRMKPTYSFPFDKIVDEYKDHFIELEETCTASIPHKENLETHELKSYRSHFKKTKSPLEVHVVLIDRQCDSQENRFRKTLTAKKSVFVYSEDEWPFSNWLVEARSRVGGSAYETGKISVIQKAGNIEVDISALGVDPSRTSVNVDITIKTKKGEYTGDATYKPHIFIAVGKTRSDESKSKTVAHEIGHGLGMVPKKDHDLQYSNANGGMGSHCRHGATPDKKSKAQGGAFSGKYTGGTCVMFGYSSESYQFCDTCKEFVKEAVLIESQMKSRGWG